MLCFNVKPSFCLPLHVFLHLRKASFRYLYRVVLSGPALCQVATSGGVAVQYSTALTGVPVLAGGASTGGLLDCGNQHLKPVSAFGHQLLVPPTLACALGQGLAGLQGLPVFDGGAAGGDGGGNVNLNAASFPANLLPHHATAAELSQMGFVSQEQRLMLQQQQQQLQLQQQQQQQMQPLQQQLLHDKVKSKYLLDATSVSDPDSDSESGSRRAKMTHKYRKN